jgi:type II secretory ATPase GspE/PulE/Tfp pilus assembly ATPase PilB-like protein
MSNEAPTSSSPHDHIRQKALQEELAQLVDVVGPGPLVDLLLERSFQLEATDIHFDPTEEGLRVRLRVDGLLHDVLKLPAEMTSHVVSRIKLMANMNITERRFSQDGHISNSVLTAQRDVRVGSGPTIYGERIVLRLMPDQSSYTELEQLGLEDDQLHLLKEHARRPSGMVMSVGPVGSGKSTTMYSCLNLLNDPQKSITTIEDPVERRITGINQIQTDPKINFGFVEALRGVLRQDPNIMMIGEVRDPETAHIGCRAALTGVMVLSTMHANDSVSTIDVFREFGIPPMFIADSVNCIVSQRLIRKVCPTSRELYHPDEAVREMLGLDPSQAESTTLVRGVPADDNFYTGYSGRTGVFEVMVISKAIRDAILKGRPAMVIRDIAQSEGMMTLEQAMRNKVLRGETSIEELHRVISTYGL